MQNILKEIRENNNISQEELARIMNVSQKTISSWEVGRTTPKVNKMQLLEDFFNIKKEDIFFSAFNYKSELFDKKVQLRKK